MSESRSLTCEVWRFAHPPPAGLWVVDGWLPPVYIFPCDYPLFPSPIYSCSLDLVGVHFFYLGEDLQVVVLVPATSILVVTCLFMYVLICKPLLLLLQPMTHLLNADLIKLDYLELWKPLNLTCEITFCYLWFSFCIKDSFLNSFIAFCTAISSPRCVYTINKS